MVVMCLCHGSSSVGMFSKLSIDVNHKEVLCGLGSSENLKKKKCLWVIFDSALSLPHGWWWNDLKDERPLKKDGDMERQGEETE